MAQVFNKIYVDVRTKNDDIITAVQNDSNSRFLDVFLFDGSTPINLTGHEVRIYCRKPESGGEVFNDGEITEPTNGRCQFPLTDQTLAKVGYVEAQIVIYYQNVQVLQSQPFNINVVESLISSGSVESSNEYGALVVLYQNLYEAHDLMTTMTQNQGNKGEISTERNIETFWQALEYVAKYMDTDLRNLLNQVLSDANVQGVIDRLGNTADTGVTTVFGKLNNMGVKSIQRGITSLSYSSSPMTITISNIDKSKAVVLLDGGTYISANSGIASPNAYLQSITNSSITIALSNVSVGSNNATNSGSVSWQVIEFN
ncbi:BppU family phage baseplate upper protein [Anaerotignum sp.]|uniref:BppU family phage baseplate upper protein n=1 Tax=Anaerotignum sp. TaxID=2039241 RepID=UPI0028AEDE1A|nr:BppU family phage baseplate upper protein [Anaerotignum sp.]